MQRYFAVHVWIETNRAHALMFLGRNREAMTLYLAHKGERVATSANKPWQQVIAEDFAILRRAGLSNPLMPKIESALGARSLVGWTRDDLAAKSGVFANTIKNFESGGSDPKLSTLHKWRRALEAAGVRFIDADDFDGPGVRLRGAPKGKRG